MSSYPDYAVCQIMGLGKGIVGGLWHVPGPTRGEDSQAPGPHAMISPRGQCLNGKEIHSFIYSVNKCVMHTYCMISPREDVHKE